MGIDWLCNLEMKTEVEIRELPLSMIESMIANYFVSSGELHDLIRAYDAKLTHESNQAQIG